MDFSGLVKDGDTADRFGNMQDLRRESGIVMHLSYGLILLPCALAGRGAVCTTAAHDPAARILALAASRGSRAQGALDQAPESRGIRQPPSQQMLPPGYSSGAARPRGSPGTRMPTPGPSRNRGGVPSASV